MMKKSISLFLLSFFFVFLRTRNTNGRIYILLSSFLFSCGHSPKADKLITNEIIQVIETSKQYKQTPFYYAEIYSSHVKWELFINGIQMFANYRGNITVPLNYNILVSGKQKLTICIYSSNGQDVLGEYAAFRLRLFYNENLN